MTDISLNLSNIIPTKYNLTEKLSIEFEEINEKKIEINSGFLSSSQIISFSKNNQEKQIPKESIALVSSVVSTSISPQGLKSLIKNFLNTIPQTYLIICILVLFILLLLIMVIILICLNKKRKREAANYNNSIDINKIVIQNSSSLNSREKNVFRAVQNNSNVSESNAPQNMSLSEIKEKNLKEEIHSIVSGTLNEMSLNKNRRSKRKKKGSTTRTNGGRSSSKSGNTSVSTKELAEEINQQIQNHIIV